MYFIGNILCRNVLYWLHLVQEMYFIGNILCRKCTLKDATPERDRKVEIEGKLKVKT